MLALQRLVLTGFRNYGRLDWTDPAMLTVITGPNGSGKTNILEALSILSPGRGLRSAGLGELAQIGGPGGFAVAGRFTDAQGDFTIGTGAAPGDLVRAYRLDDETRGARVQAAWRLPALWLTPQMERLFQEPASGRRKFLDRLVGALDPAHGGQVAAHDRAIAQRNRLLARPPWDDAWLCATEDAIARHAVAAAAARRATVAALNACKPPGFPAARLDLIDPVAELLAQSPALAAEAAVRDKLRAARPRDAALGQATIGAHRADLALADAVTGRPAARASTGEQKALLVGIVLAQATLAQRQTGRAPMLLLDEPLVHLDATRRAALFAAVAGRAAPTLLTGTDLVPFGPLSGLAAFFRAEHGSLTL